MKQTSMVIVVYCLTVKFRTLTSIGYVKANQVITRQCHLHSLQLTGNTKIHTNVLAIERSLVEKIPLDHLDHKDDLFKT